MDSGSVATAQVGWTIGISDEFATMGDVCAGIRLGRTCGIRVPAPVLWIAQIVLAGLSGRIGIPPHAWGLDRAASRQWFCDRAFSGNAVAPCSNDQRALGGSRVDSAVAVRGSLGCEEDAAVVTLLHFSDRVCLISQLALQTRPATPAGGQAGYQRGRVARTDRQRDRTAPNRNPTLSTVSGCLDT